MVSGTDTGTDCPLCHAPAAKFAESPSTMSKRMHAPSVVIYHELPASRMPCMPDHNDASAAPIDLGALAAARLMKHVSRPITAMTATCHYTKRTSPSMCKPALMLVTPSGVPLPRRHRTKGAAVPVTDTTKFTLTATWAPPGVRNAAGCCSWIIHAARYAKSLW